MICLPAALRRDVHAVGWGVVMAVMKAQVLFYSKLCMVVGHARPHPEKNTLSDSSSVLTAGKGAVHPG